MPLDPEAAYDVEVVLGDLEVGHPRRKDRGGCRGSGNPVEPESRGATWAATSTPGPVDIMRQGSARNG